MFSSSSPHALPELVTPAQTRMLSRVSEALRAQPEVFGVWLLGSHADGTADSFSDLDIQVGTVNLRTTRSSLPGILNSVGSVDIRWPIHESSDRAAYTVLFGNESLYHGLDLGLVQTMGSEGVARTMERPYRNLWTRPYKDVAASPGHVLEPPLALSDLASFRLGQALAGVRYLKARRRERWLTCLRFVIAQAEWLLAVKSGGNPPLRKLTTGELGRLDRQLGSSSAWAFVESFDLSTPGLIDEVFLRLLEDTLRCTAASDGSDAACDLYVSICAEFVAAGYEVPVRITQDHTNP